ncbi:MAG: class SAM-dependent methyltransferase [Ilumatobacteraceae bacterium]|nr:class SAM-dependent methyltransferase [Ilumatobacteraceae bacterium]
MYESVNSYGPGEQPDFCSSLAAELGARTIVDLGCGTGLITRQLALEGYEMIGVEPSAAMLTIARRRPQGDRVTWIEGRAEHIGTPAADLAIMTGHVAQFFVTDDSWIGALIALRAALRPGGRLMFESRNPLVREWERWTPAAAVVVDDPAFGRVRHWSDVHDVSGDTVTYSNHYVFTETDDEVVSPTKLRFRSEDQLTRSLVNAGFTIEHIYGDWDRRPPTPTTRELIFIATR